MSDDSITIGPGWEPHGAYTDRGPRVSVEREVKDTYNQEVFVEIEVFMPTGKDAQIDLSLSEEYEGLVAVLTEDEAVWLATRLLEAAEYKRQYDEQRPKPDPDGVGVRFMGDSPLPGWGGKTSRPTNAYEDPATNPNYDRMRAEDNGYYCPPTGNEPPPADPVATAKLAFDEWMRERYGV